MPTPAGKPITLVAAVARNGVIGDGPRIPWRVPGEQASFKQFTLGHTLVMGRATYESIGRPLPGRETIVLTRDPAWMADGVRVASSLPAAYDAADGLSGDVMVAGGGAVYLAAIPDADALVISEIPEEPEGDVYFPALDPTVWVELQREHFDGFDRVHWVRAR